MAESSNVPLELGSTATGEELRKFALQPALGSPEDGRRLADFAVRANTEVTNLRRTLRKQEHDSLTLFEMVGQINARSLNLSAMQTYLLRTVSGHFATPKLLILRRMKESDKEFSISANQGWREPNLRLNTQSALNEEALRRRYCMFLKELPPALSTDPGVVALQDLGVELCVPLIQEIETPEVVLEGLLALGPRLGGRPYLGQDLEFLNTLGKMLAICLRNEALYRRSIVDDLTGVASRGHFEARLTTEISRVQIYGHRSIGLVMVDVDKFKGFNDRFGHQTGDRVLKELAQVLVGQVRNVDLVARYGGEEFTVILLEIDRQRLFDIAERLRKSVESMELQAVDGTPLKITASFGAACFPDDARDKWELIQIADRALYAAKTGGRNRIVMSHSLPPASAAAPEPAEGAATTETQENGTTAPKERRKTRMLLKSENPDPN